jgi:RNA polymerase sigma factor (sigma-70 family)
MPRRPAEPGSLLPPERARHLVRWCLDCGAVQAGAGSDCQACGSWYEAGCLYFEELYKSYVGPLQRFVRRLAADWEIPESQADTDGIVQETFEVLLSGSGQPIRNPGAWLFTVARNKLRRLAAAQAQAASGDSAGYVDTSTAAWTSLAPAASTEDIRVAREIVQEIAGLPGHQKIATYLRQVQGWSLAEIGAYLNCAASTAGVHISRGTGKVRSSLFPERTAYCRSPRGHVYGKTVAYRVYPGWMDWTLLVATAAGMPLAAAVAHRLGMPWWQAAVAFVVTAVVVPLVAVAAVGLLLFVSGVLWEQIDAWRCQRRFNCWLKTGRPMARPRLFHWRL